MSKFLFKHEDLCSQITVDSTVDLKLSPGVNLNAPPSDERCQCCGKHISQLTPFSDTDIVDGSLLVKSWRPATIPGEWEREVMYESQERVPGKPDEWYGADDVFDWSADCYWECSECFYLDDVEFYRQMFSRIDREEELALYGDGDVEQDIPERGLK